MCADSEECIFLYLHMNVIAFLWSVLERVVFVSFLRHLMYVGVLLILIGVSGKFYASLMSKTNESYIYSCNYNNSNTFF